MYISSNIQLICRDECGTTATAIRDGEPWMYTYWKIEDRADTVYFFSSKNFYIFYEHIFQLLLYLTYIKPI